MTYHIVCDNDPCVCTIGPVRELKVEIDEATWKAIKQEAGGGSIEDRAASILIEHARRQESSGKHGWMNR